MKITLQPEQERFIRSQLDTGRYETIEQVIDEALQLLEKRNNKDSERQIEELRQKISIATEQITKGQVTDGEIVFDRLQEKLRCEYGL